MGLWIQETESKHFWMQIFDDIKSRGVQEVGFICMDGLTGLEEGAKAIFPNTVVQRCIVHLIRNSLKYVPTKDYKEFCAHLKKIYAVLGSVGKLIYPVVTPFSFFTFHRSNGKSEKLKK